MGGWNVASRPSLNVPSCTPEKLHEIASAVESWQVAVAKALELLPLSEGFSEKDREVLLAEVLTLDVAELHGWAELLESGKATWNEASQTP